MGERNWARITSGATFESLATTIIFFEDPAAALFGRRGKDGGQDARSGDRKRVFQAKFHANGSAAAAIRDAQAEAAKIKDYRKQGHSRAQQWAEVTHWRLVTNVAFNPTDDATWNELIVPLFSEQGLTIDYWTRPTLDGLLDKHPEIHRSFFDNETRALLSVPEVKERLPSQEPFLQRTNIGDFFGRSPELSEINSFLESSQLFVVVHGAGGIGKTRLLVEAGEAIASKGVWQVLWANVATMAATGSWFEAIVPERPTLLLVDEPPDAELLRQLAEQLGGTVGRASRWKVVVAVRSPNDPVLRFLFGPRMKSRVRELPLASLEETSAEAMCGSLLASGALAGELSDWRSEAARELSRRFSRHPVWLTLAVHVLEKTGRLAEVPATAGELADAYLEEIYNAGNTPPDQIRSLLRWVALIGTVNRENDATITMIGAGIGENDVTEVRRQLADLVARRVLTQWGANNRLVDIKPDVVRDHILLRWLSVDTGFGDTRVQASADAKSLVASIHDAINTGTVTNLHRAVLVSVAHTQFLLKLAGHHVPLLDHFVEQQRAGINELTASKRIALLDLMRSVAVFQPVLSARLATTLRTSNVEDELIATILGERRVHQRDVILALAWPVFHAAMGAETEEEQLVVLTELCAIAEAEGQLGTALPNDGRRASSLVTRVVEGGPQFVGEYHAAVRALGEALLDRVSRDPPTSGMSATVKALVQPAVAIERHQTWSDEHRIHMQRFAITREHPAWTTRDALISRIRAIISAPATPPTSKYLLWDILVEAHRNVNRVCQRGDEKHEPYFTVLMDDLIWVQRVVADSVCNAEELRKARQLWDWHSRFEKDPDLRSLSDALEKIYRSDALAAEFEPLIGRESLENRLAVEAATAERLAHAKSAEDIFAFFDRAVAFFGSDKDLSQLTGVAVDLGPYARSREVVRDFIFASLQQALVTPRSELGVRAAVGWVVAVRASYDPSVCRSVVRDLLVRCGSDAQRIRLLLQLYWHGGNLTPGEHDLLRSSKTLFIQTGHAAEFVEAVASTIPHDWAGTKNVVAEVLDALPAEMLTAALLALVEGTHRAVFNSDAKQMPDDLAVWLLDQLVRIPDANSIGGNAEWYLEDTLKRLPRAPLSWLPQSLERRRSNETTSKHAIGYEARFSKYVQRISEHNCTDVANIAAVGALLDFLFDDGSVGYYLPELLADVDPDGLVVAPEVEKRAKMMTEAEDVRRLARIGGAYLPGSAAWRRVAKAVLRHVPLDQTDSRRALFTALSDRMPQAWTGKVGEVAARFATAVELAKTSLAAENDPDLRPFWEWRLACAERELVDEQERVKEELRSE